MKVPLVSNESAIGCQMKVPLDKLLINKTKVDD